MAITKKNMLTNGTMTSYEGICEAFDNIYENKVRLLTKYIFRIGEN